MYCIFVLDWQGNSQAYSASTYVPLRTPQTKSTVVFFFFFFFIFYFLLQENNKKNKHPSQERRQTSTIKYLFKRENPAPYQCLPSPSSLLSKYPNRDCASPHFCMPYSVSVPSTCAVRCLLIFLFVCHVGKKKARMKKEKRNICFKHTYIIHTR